MKNDPQLSAIERAMILAREGRMRSVNDIRVQVRREGYAGSDSHLSGPTITSQLGRMLRATQTLR